MVVSERAAHEAGAIALLQDFALLKIIIRAWIGVYLEKVDSGRIDPDRVDWLLCHYSAKSLREVDEVLVVAPDEYRPPLEIVRRDLANIERISGGESASR